MCYKMICTRCKKITWGGCGKHIESALKGVPLNQRCKCNKRATYK